MKKILLLLLVVLSATGIACSQDSTHQVFKLRLKLKMFSLGPMNFLRPSMKIPEIYPSYLGDPKLFGKDYPEQYTRMNLSPEQKLIQTDYHLKDSLSLVTHVQVELRNNPAGRGFGNFSTFGWLDTNGNIIGLYGGSLDFNLITPGQYWVAVHLPNTFPVLTPVSFDITNQPGQIIQWDFTTDQSKNWDNCLYQVSQQNVWATMTCDVDNTGILDMGDLSVMNNTLGFTGYDKCDIDFNNHVDTLIDWTFLLQNFFEQTSVPNPYDFKRPEIIGDASTNDYVLKATNFNQQKNITAFDIMIKRTKNIPINLRSIQCVFRYTKNPNLSNLRIVYNRNFWYTPQLLTDSALIVSGLCFPDSAYYLDTSYMKLFSVNVTGNLDSLRWGNTGIQRTKLYLNPGYVEFTNPANHFIDLLTSVVVGNNNVIPTKFLLSQNYPNPFNPTTHIKFNLPEKTHVRLDIYDMNGKIVDAVITSILNAGTNDFVFDGSKLASGVYFYKLTTENYTDTKKFVLIK